MQVGVASLVQGGIKISGQTFLMDSAFAARFVGKNFQSGISVAGLLLAEAFLTPPEYLIFIFSVCYNIFST